MRNLHTFGAILLLAVPLFAQEQKPQQPQVKVNFLNVCSPSDEEKAEIASTLEKLPSRPRFAVDFEVSRGRSTMDENSIAAGPGAQMSTEKPEVSSWVRVRKEFPENSPYSNVQYSFSLSGDKAVETLVFRSREAKDVMQVSLSDTVTAPPNPVQVVATSTPPDRIRLERFGKSSVVLARCPNADQSGYESLFRKASTLMNLYRETLGVRRVVTQELPKVQPATPKTAPKR